jgi:hypothetical protein
MSATMKVGPAIAAILKREGVEILAGYPVNHLTEFAAAADIRPIIVRQRRIGLHMADAISRMTSDRKLRGISPVHRIGKDGPRTLGRGRKAAPPCPIPAT